MATKAATPSVAPIAGTWSGRRCRWRASAAQPISRHTVPDHTKAIFAKLAVGSRRELMAKLFHDHYLPTPNYDRHCLTA
jgi:hypothetical protein